MGKHKRDDFQRGKGKQKPLVENWGILCEGETEFFYFKDFSNTAIKILPQKLSGITDKGINKAMRSHSPREIDHYWLVIDKDKLSDAKFNELAAFPKVTAAWSNICFEAWLLLHFQDTLSYANKCAEIERALTKYLPHYKKGQKNTYSMLQEKKGDEPAAIARAKKLVERWQKDMPNDYAQHNPCTLVHVLVEKIRERQ